jgi:hypothetical protein
MEFNVKFATSNCPIEYNNMSNKPTLLASGLRDLDKGIRYTACKNEPAGDVILGPVNINNNNGSSFTNMFQSSFNFFNKTRNMKSTSQQMVGLGSMSQVSPYQIRIINGEIKYKDSEPPQPPSFRFPYYIYKTHLPAQYYRKLLVTEPNGETDAENVADYIITLIQPPSESARIRRDINNEFWRIIQD